MHTHQTKRHDEGLNAKDTVVRGGLQYDSSRVCLFFKIKNSVNKVIHIEKQNKKNLSHKHAKKPINECLYIYISKKQKDVFTWGGNLQKSFATQIFDRFAVINF
jgi:hypothetical protein